MLELDKLKETVFAVCSSFVFIEIITFLAKDKTMKFVCSLVYTLVILSALSSAVSFFRTDLDFSYPDIQYDEESICIDNTSMILRDNILKALNAAGISCEDVEIKLDMNDEGEVSVDKLVVITRYDVDRVRSREIVDNLFSGMVDIEVISDEKDRGR